MIKKLDICAFKVKKTWQVGGLELFEFEKLFLIFITFK